MRTAYDRLSMTNGIIEDFRIEIGEEAR